MEVDEGRSTTITSTAEPIELKAGDDLVLQPLLTPGELVQGEWWQPAVTEPASSWTRNALFIFTILLPITAGIIYFGFLTGDQYVSEAHFIVRTSSHDEIGNLAALVQNQKLSRAADETYALTDFMTSRDALSLVSGDGLIQRLLNRPEAGPFERFPALFFLNTQEKLYRRFKQHVTATIDSESGISTLTVNAFTPSDAQALATALLDGGERLINQLNMRAHEDALGYAEKNVGTARARLDECEDRLAKFRNANKIIAPDQEASASLKSITDLRGELAELKAKLRQSVALTPRSPALNALREQIRALQAEADSLTKNTAGNRGSLAGKLGEYESLALDRALAAKALESSTLVLDTAERDARQQQLYVETIVAPGRPDQALYPYRTLSILIVVVSAFVLRWFIDAVGRTILEHRA